MINNQEVLVDLNSNSKGEGLRSYLKKDALAEQYLDDYQASTTTQLKSAALGTFGFGLIIGGALYSSDDDDDKDFTIREGMIGAGLGLLVLNYLMFKTIEFNNEEKLERSIEEYNKRNVPKIYFVPYKDDQAYHSNQRSNGYGIAAGYITSF